MQFGTSSPNVHVLMFPSKCHRGGLEFTLFSIFLGLFLTWEMKSWSMTLTSYNVLNFIKETWTISCIYKYFQVLVNASLYITNNVWSIYEWICTNEIGVCSTFSTHMCFLILGLRALPMHLLHMILRFYHSCAALVPTPTEALQIDHSLYR